MHRIHQDEGMKGELCTQGWLLALQHNPFNIWNLGTLISNNTQYGVTIATIWGGE